MDAFTFISEIVDSLAWPVAAVILTRVLKVPITDLIPLLRKLKYKELEMEFSQEVAELKAGVTALEPSVDTPNITQTSPQNRLFHLASFSTRAAIIEAWLEVEAAATETASTFWSIPHNETIRSYPRLGEYLLQCKVINNKQLETFNKLRELRNKAAHIDELHLSVNDAKSYIELASALAAHIRASKYSVSP